MENDENAPALYQDGYFHSYDYGSADMTVFTKGHYDEDGLFIVVETRLV